MTNLEKFYGQGSTPEQIKAMSSYTTATPEKKAIIDSFLQGKQKVEQATNEQLRNPETIFQTLKAGGAKPPSVNSYLPVPA
jgi:hypothetical protein